MSNTKISWADKVWNPVTGCTKISEGCRNCYAERMTKRLAGRCGYSKENPFGVTLHLERVEEPLHWRKPSKIFVCSMGDLFHEDVPDEFIDRVLITIHKTQKHTFLILTKRPQRMSAYFLNLQCPDRAILMSGRDNYCGSAHALALKLRVGETIPNLWLGVSVENQKTADERIPLLLQTPAAKRFVSYEPALGPVDFKPYTRIAWQCSYCRGYFPDPLKEICPSCNKKGGWTGSHAFNPPGGQRGSGLNWIVMGGESGPGARPMHPVLARSVRDQCKAAGVAFFFKQWGEWVPAYMRPNAISEFEGDVISASGGTMDGKCDGQLVYRVGKSAAGCLLDGKEHKEMP